MRVNYYLNYKVIAAKDKISSLFGQSVFTNSGFKLDLLEFKNFFF